MQLSALTTTLARFASELQRRKVIRVASAYVVVAWIVLQVALALQSAIALSSQFSAVILALLVIGFPVAVALAWFFEITPEGVKRTSPAAGDGALVKPQTTDMILAGALGLVVIVALAQWFMPQVTTPAAPTTTTAQTAPAKPEPPPALGDKSIAVLPFANLSPDKENEYFADGLTEELLTLLAKTGDLKVISRTSSFAFKGKNTPLPEIAKQLGVRHILEGTVRDDGDELRVTAQLIDVTTDTHLWSNTYKRKFEDAFAVQEEVARAIAGALNLEITLAAGPHGAPTQSIEAYRLFLKARELYRLRNVRGSVPESIDLFKRAIALDPQYAEAHAGLAGSYLAQASRIEGLRANVDFDEFAPLARRSAETALKLNPNLAQPYVVLGILARLDLQWEVSVGKLSKALEYDPADTLALSYLGYAKLLIGEVEAATRIIEQAKRIDPLFILIDARIMQAAFVSGDDRRAVESALKFVQSSYESGYTSYLTLAAIAQTKGDHEQAEQHFRAFMDAWGKNKSLVEPIAQALRSKAMVRAAVKAVREEQINDPTLEPERLFLLLGEEDAFFDELNTRLARGEKARVSYYLSIAWRWVVLGGGANPKFKEFMRNIGLVDYWKKHGWPDRCRAKGEDDFECS